LEFRDFRTLNVRDLTTNRENKGLAKINGFTVPETTAQTPRKLTISGNEFVLIANATTGDISSFSRHKLFKDKLT
jgi:hypothetical protein